MFPVILSGIFNHKEWFVYDYKPSHPQPSYTTASICTFLSSMQLINVVHFCHVPFFDHYINRRSLYRYIHVEIKDSVTRTLTITFRNITRRDTMKMRTKERCKLRRYLQLTHSFHWWYIKRDHYTRNFVFHEVICKQTWSVTYAVKMSYIIRNR